MFGEVEMTAMIALLHRLVSQDDSAERAFQARLAAMAKRPQNKTGRPSPFRFTPEKASRFSAA